MEKVLKKDETEILRANVLELREKGRVKITDKLLNAAKLEQLRALHDGYVSRRTKRLAGNLLEMVNKHGSNFLQRLDLIADAEQLREDLNRKEELLEDLEDLLHGVHSFCSRPGFVQAGLTVAGHVASHKTAPILGEAISLVNQEEEEEPFQPERTGETTEGSQS